MVVDDAPTIGKTLPDEGEYSAEVALFALQVPVAQNQHGVRTQKTKFQVGKIELAHGGAVWISFLVTSKHAFPPARDTVASGKSELRRMPIAGEKCIDVAAVPSVLLRGENGVDGATVGFSIVVFVREDTRLRECEKRKYQEADRSRSHELPTAIPHRVYPVEIGAGTG